MLKSGIHSWSGFGVFAFGSSILLSAFLLFLIQPLLAKKLLPWFGGSPAVWLSIILFFQTALLLGYLYAYFLTRIEKPAHQVYLHLVLLTISVCFLPIAPVETFAHLAISQPLSILLILSTTLLLPVIMIASSSPLLQYWYCNNYETAFPYRYYAWSNFGSLLGLLAFPFLLEPFVGISKQLLGWSILYGLYFVSASLCAVITLYRGKRKVAPIQPIVPDTIPKKTIALWLLLTMMSCTLLLTTTQVMMQDAMFPLLWVIPLTLYLISFIMTFSEWRFYYRPFWILLYTITVGLVLYYPSHHEFTLRIQVLIYSTLLFTGCMICHGELVRLKPNPRHLPFYYLMIACGGVLGGIFVNLVAPVIFNDWYDFYLVVAGIYIAVGLLLFNFTQPQIRFKQYYQCVWLGGLCALAFLLNQYITASKDGVIYTHRNFFGKAEILERHSIVTHYRSLRNGSILHGQQYMDPQRRLLPTSYYAYNSGVGLAIQYTRQQKTASIYPGIRIGVLGLGAGTIAALAKEGDFIRFYEIDPDINKIAQTFFFYLKDTLAKHDVVIGDGRIELDRSMREQGSQQFDVLAIDAFNGDAIPMHLLTVEAMRIYLAHLSQNGILAFHVSSRYVDLYPPIQAIATFLGLSIFDTHNASDETHWVSGSEWILLSRKPDIGLFLFQQNALNFPEKRMDAIWTDDQNHLLSVIRW